MNKKTHTTICKRAVLLSLFLCMVTILMAGPIDSLEALRRARHFVNSRNATAPRKVKMAHQTARKTSATTASQYYVFNVGDREGFVIVSGDDQTAQILGYADNGTFEPDNIPSNMKAWLDGYSRQIDWLRQHQGLSASSPKTVEREKIAPLIQTQWNQGVPYNNDCPTFLNGAKSVTGCVATAMAQLMYYHQWPAASTKTIPSYTWAKKWGNEQLHNEMKVTEFHWDDMLLTYSKDETNTNAVKAVSTLMSYCGAAVKMDYADNVNGGSLASSTLVPEALKDYFDYSATTRYIDRDNYTIDKWTEVIYSELEARRPVFYSGQSSGGGHAFIVDGYDSDDLFHVNWGWGGFCDGYFLLTVLHPDSDEGIGASHSADGYSYGQDAIIGIKKNEGEPPVSDPSNQQTLLLSSEFNSISGTTAYYKLFNTTGENITFSFGLGYVDDENIIHPISSTISTTYLSNNTGWRNKGFTISDLPEGVYKVIPISKTSEATKYGTDVDINFEYIEVTVTSTTTTLSYVRIMPLSISEFSFDGYMRGNTPLTINVLIHNNGKEFYGPIYMFMSPSDSMGENKGACGVTILEGGDATLVFKQTPADAGTYNIWLATDEEGKNIIGHTTVNIGTQVTTTKDPANLTMTYEFTNLSEGGHFLGDHVDTKITVTNPVANSLYSGKLYVRLWEWDNVQGKTVAHEFINIEVIGDETKELKVSFNDVNPSCGYSIDFKASFNKNYVDNTFYDIYDRHTFAEYITAYDMYGTPTTIEAQAAFTADEHTTAVDLSGTHTTKNVMAYNPNCLIIISPDMTAPMTGGTKNIVVGNTTDKIAITDGYDFATPIDITAKEVTYTRTFNSGLTTGGKGWLPLVIPFNVSSVTELRSGKETAIDWYHNTTDKEKDFWVMELTGYDNNILTFTPAEVITADKTYIIGMPGQEWGADNCHTGIPIVFKGTDQSLVASMSQAVTIDNYEMRGVIMTTTTDNAYTINDEGTAFVKTQTATIDPFRAYITETEPTDTDILYIGIPFGDKIVATEINTIINRENGTKCGDNCYYTIDGIRLSGKPSKKGIYIINGKKVVF
ncbi:MAG: C10 family peptidase [Prevotella sp.]|nr:C10 family peptidase [Prevotella sp.]